MYILALIGCLLLKVSQFKNGIMKIIEIKVCIMEANPGK